MHKPRNAEIRNAFTFLLGNKVFKNQTEAAKLLAVTKGRLSNILNDRETAGPDFCEKFEKKFLAAFKTSLNKFREPVPVTSTGGDYATHEEFTAAKVVRLEIMVEELTSLCASIRAHQEGHKDSSQIRRRLKISVDTKVSTAQVLLSGK